MFTFRALKLAEKLSKTPQICRSVSNGGIDKSLLGLKPYEFTKHMKKNNVRRWFVVFDDNAMQSVCSHPKTLHEVKTFLDSDPNYLNHEGVFFEVGRRSGALMGAFVWRTNRGQACGGIRLWEYDSMTEYIQDGLRLAQGMGLKSALAGLWAGGGKGVIASPSPEKMAESGFRTNLFLDYGDFLSSLKGCYVGAEDAGVVVDDLDTVYSRTRYITCISEEKGGSGNPSVATGMGVVCAMEAALHHLDMGGMEGKRVVSQGVGNVARVIIDCLLDKDVESIYASDCNAEALELAEKMFKDKSNGRLQLEHVGRGELGTLAKPCDVLSPNALGNVLRADTIPSIQARIVCGAANNQLEGAEDAKLLKDAGIAYIVDFMCNRMGIVNCANEAYGHLTNDPAKARHFDKKWEHSLWNVTQRVLREAEEKGTTTLESALRIADRESLEWHPVWPKRGQDIIDDLVEYGWQDM